MTHFSKIQTSKGWVRGAKNCSSNQRELSGFSYHYSALIEREGQIKRLDFCPDEFFIWKSQAEESEILAWWKVSKKLRVETEDSAQNLLEYFSSFYETFSKVSPEVVLRFAFLLRKLRKLEIERLDSGKWKFFCKERSDDDFLILETCELSLDPLVQIKETSIIREFCL